MSYIEGIALLGVRSFSPDEPSYLKFFSPVTVIVGPNGSGKTSIIESMKYACTGDLPPNSRGGAFVHDPKIAGSTEVKAQIKLKFRNINGHKLVCSRSLQVTQKKTNITQKAIDNSLKKEDPNTGEISSISSRCADLDSEIPFHLGVPKAVLDNVIFCHQEDSNWPLSESSVLKKKFDDIFSSKKYAVALENLKSTNKSLSEKLNINNTKLEALKANAEKAKRVRAHITQLHEQAQTRTTDIESAEARLTSVDDKLKKLEDLVKQINANTEQIQRLENQKENVENTLLNLQETITPRSESMAELKDLLRQHRDREQQVVQEEQVILDKKEQIERNTQKSQQALSSLHTDLGRLQAVAEENERNKQKCIGIIEDGNGVLSLNMPLQDNQKAKQMLSRHLSKVEKENEKSKNEALTKQSVMREELEKLKNKYISAKESFKHLQNTITQEKHQINNMKQKIAQDSISQSTIDEVTANLKDAESRLETIKSEANFDQIQEEIDTKNQLIQEYEESNQSLNEESMALNRQGDSRTRLSLKRGEKEEKEEMLKRLYDECDQDATALLGYVPDLDSFDRRVSEFIKEKKDDLKRLEEAKTSALKQISTAGAIQSSSIKKSKKLMDEIKDIKKLIDEVSPNKPVPEAIAQTDEQIKHLRNKLSNVDGAELLYSKFIEKAQKGHYCPLCSRDYDDDNELEKFIGTLTTIFERIPSKKGKAEEQLKNYETQREKLETVHGPYVRLSSLEQELATIEQDKRTSKDEKVAAQDEYQRLGAQEVELKQSLEKADTLFKVSDNITRLRKEIDQLTQVVLSLEDDLSATGSTRTVHDCQREMADITKLKKTAQEEVNALQKKRESTRQKMYTIENKTRDFRERLVSLNHRMNFRTSLEAQMEEHEKKLEEHESQAETNKNGLVPLQEKVEQESNTYEKAVSDWNATERNAQANERHIRKIIEDLDSLSRIIQKQEASTNSDRLSKIMEKKSALEQKLKDYEKEMKHLADDLRQIENDQINRRSIERDLMDQIKLHGELIQVNEQITRYENELRTDYNNVDGEYAGLFIQARTTELITKDLDFYQKALKNAVMNYHTLKMKDLNKLIREMWVNTYKGGDIDYIEIKADNEGTAVNRSFNYRVVMYQRGTELNMRGRCSAGQKVLAAIIIRLALAEAFCSTCGVFTLDEPTTNLDRDNIESLAENLANLINTKRQQANFQLVIITHDEEFVECLSRSNIAERYYRVSKDHLHHSTIRVQSFTQVGSGPVHDESIYE
ncbi:hypothetical protein K501DRAFT_283766, partial [Backusella circina FSU 941]